MKMNSPYMGKFRVTQAYKGDSVHDGLDLVGIDSKEIHATASGTVHYAGWENSADHFQKSPEFPTPRAVYTTTVTEPGRLLKLNVQSQYLSPLTALLTKERSRRNNILPSCFSQEDSYFILYL